MSAASIRSITAACLLAVWTAGCGYTTGLSLAPEYQNIGIEIFGNDSLLRDLERELHQEVTRSARNLAGVPIGNPRTADLVIDGRINLYLRRGGVRSKENRLRESAVRIEVVSELREGGTRRVLAGPVTCATQVGYTLDTPGNEREARQRALKILADQIVLDLLTQAVPPEAEDGL